MTEMAETVIGLLHPGEMGTAVAAGLTARGHLVRWVSEGRGPATAARAARAGLADAGTVTALAGQATIILSVCPPHAALDTARAVAAAGFTGLYVDANAISPGTAREVQAVVEAGGGRYVDGGIVGPPPERPAPGDEQAAGQHPALPGWWPRRRGRGRARRTGGGALRGHRPEPPNSPQRQPGRGVGPEDGVRRVDQGQRRAAPGGPGAGPGRGGGGQPAGRVGAVPAGAGTPVAGRGPVRRGKGWRWVGEMEEIGASMTADGLPGGFHQAAAEVFRRAHDAGGGAADGPGDALLGAVLAALLAGGA